MLRLLTVAISGSLAASCVGGGSPAAADPSSTSDASATSTADATATRCEPQACGPAMLAPNYLCTDGTVGGPGPCVRKADGQCRWSYRSCEAVTPCAACTLAGVQPTACEPPYIGRSGPSGTCVVQPDGSCAELQLRCFLP